MSAELLKIYWSINRPSGNCGNNSTFHSDTLQGNSASPSALIRIWKTAIPESQKTPPAGSSSPEVHIDLLRQRLRQYEKLLQSLESQLQLKTQLIQNLIVGREIENKL
jgi:hypothetical protein